LDDLEKRVSELEFAVRGNGTISKEDDIKNPLNDRLVKITQNLANIQTQYEPIAQFLKQYTASSSLINSAGGDEFTLSDSAKLEVILACEDSLKNTSESLKTISELQKFVNPESLQTVPKLFGQLKQIEVTNLDQKALTSEVCENLAHQITSYNTIIDLLSKKFIYWDQMLQIWEEKLGIVKSS